MTPIDRNETNTPGAGILDTFTLPANMDGTNCIWQVWKVDVAGNKQVMLDITALAGSVTITSDMPLDGSTSYRLMGIEVG